MRERAGGLYSFHRFLHCLVVSRLIQNVHHQLPRVPSLRYDLHSSPKTLPSGTNVWLGHVSTKTLANYTCRYMWLLPPAISHQWEGRIVKAAMTHHLIWLYHLRLLNATPPGYQRCFLRGTCLVKGLCLGEGSLDLNCVVSWLMTIKLVAILNVGRILGVQK